MHKDAQRSWYLVGLALVAGCGVGYISSDPEDVASQQAELTVEDCLEQHGFDAGFLGHDGGFSAFEQCAAQAGHHGCGADGDGGMWIHHDHDGGFPFGFGHHDGGWFPHHCDGGFGHGFDGGWHHHGDGGNDGDADDDGGP